MSINKEMDKEDVVHIYTMEYYSTIKKNKVMPFIATWTELEKQVKDKYHMISLTCGI